MVDIDKSSDLKKLKERADERKSRLDVLNRRMSISTPDLVLGGPKGNQAVLTIPNNQGRRLSLCVPDEGESPNMNRRVSIGGRRNSTGNGRENIFLIERFLVNFYDEPYQ